MREVFPNNHTDFTPKEVLRHITHSRELNSDGYVFVILGKVGPTGKTWLCNELLKRGLEAIEITPSIYQYASYNDDDNHLIVDDERGYAVIVLNRRIIDFSLE